MICVYPDRGPVNEDVFAAPSVSEGKPVDTDIQDITEQIHRLLLQVPELKNIFIYYSFSTKHSYKNVSKYKGETV